MTEMATINAWQENNDRYLAAALAWLRRRLRRLADDGPVADLTVPPRESGGFFGFGRRRDAATPAAPRESQPRPTGDEAEAQQQMMAAGRYEPGPALVLLAERLGLTEFERHVLLLCAAMELDTRLPRLCAKAQDDEARPFPTFALALALFDEPSWSALSPERPLRAWRLIEITQPAAQPLTTSALRADERVVNYIKGLNYLDDRLAPLLAPFEAAAEALPPSQSRAAARAARAMLAAQADRSPVVQLLGPDGLSKQLVAQAAAATLGRVIVRLPAENLPAEPGQLEQIGRLWARESLLQPVALYLDAQEADEGPATPAWQRFLAHTGGLFFLSAREARPALGNAGAVEVERPTPAEQVALWAEALDETGGDAVPADSPRRLAGQFNLNALTIRAVAAQAAAEAGGDNEPLGHVRVWDACLANTRPRLDLLAQRIDPKATWDDIVLPADAEEPLRQIAAQVAQRHRVYDEWGFRERQSRGLGISALFSGESGTGKTMAAEVLANELRLNLYRIDLSAVVSKYIGETEKNLRRLFDAAEDGGAILFFDEADALFGKRTEVKDSHDRYANIEVNYLLQRMEAFRGLAILATNMRSALDTAFLRRLRFVVALPFPGAAQRKLIWQRAFPRKANGLVLDGLEYDALARLNLSGGSIHNVALNAAFLAAAGDGRVTMPLLLQSARAEMRKMERPIREADFRWVATNAN
jgi:AAA+ superfamily predicted ATPase